MPPEDIKPLADAIFRDKVRRAREQSPAEKFVDVLLWHDEMTEWAKAGIRSEFPQADEAEIDRILEERRQRLRRAQEHGIYFPVEQAS
jgi:hypothetical protein